MYLVRYVGVCFRFFFAILSRDSFSINPSIDQDTFTQHHMSRLSKHRYIEAFKMWFYRRLLRIPKTQHKMNEWILGKLKVERELPDRVKSLKLGFYGHTTRKYESMEKEMVQGCAPGCRTRGRQRRRWTDDITEWTGMKITKRLQQRKIVIVGEGYYAPPTLLM